jgi:predicted lactoylglutathione lyase
VLTPLDVESIEAVGQMVNKALEAGASETRMAEDHGFMYGRAFDEPDGYFWEVFRMDKN